MLLLCRGEKETIVKSDFLLEAKVTSDISCGRRKGGQRKYLPPRYKMHWWDGSNNTVFCTKNRTTKVVYLGIEATLLNPQEG